MKHATSQDCAEALLHGVPDNFTSDRGPAFTSQLWKSLGDLMGTDIHHTTAYNPAANGMVEQTHRTLKAALMARCNGPDWKAQLPWVLLGMHTSPKEELGVSPPKWCSGRLSRYQAKFFPQPTVLQTTTTSLHYVKPWGSTGHVSRHIRSCLHDTFQSYSTHVFVRNDAHRSPLTRPYRGPYAVLERNRKAYRLSIAGRSDWVSIDRLKPAYVDEEDPPSSSARAGGPPHTPPHKNGPASTSPREDSPRLASSRTGRTIRQPHRLNL
uniref:Integrase catalytic domain-containing protein n=1 Tax=Scylla olivacea TaxID=85551 RepID=A0A0P4VUF2_SCYOL